MSELTDLSPAQLRNLANQLTGEYAGFKARGLSLDMTRGKPCPEQLDLANGMLDCIGDNYCVSGTDCRNYGGVDGLPEVKALFAALLGTTADRILIGGNSSLALMHDTVLRYLVKGVSEDAEPWVRQGKPKFLCPCPGYDRHFAICETFDIDMLPVDIGPDGPDMDQVEDAAGSDPMVKGIWCVPKYSNPTGVTFSDQVVDRFAVMRTAAADFRIFWDNAYAFHHLTESPDQLKDLLAACSAAGNPDRALVFASTSKITFAGAGLAAMAASPANLAWITHLISKQTIGPDKLNQLRHLRFLRDVAGVESHMRKHAEVIGPKFSMVLEILGRELGGTGCAEWSRPNGGYFVSLDTRPGCASRTVELAAAAGVKLTPAGATFPYKSDPRDRNLRIAPTLPPLDAIQTAMQLVTLCIKLASLELLLGEKLLS